jgi:hypothetical protein
MGIKDELNQYWKADELRKFASELKIKGRSKMRTSELIEAIANRLEES